MIYFWEADLTFMVSDNVVCVEQEFESAADGISAYGTNDWARIPLKLTEPSVKSSQSRGSNFDTGDFFDITARAEEAVALPG
jgi:hypothetical protein